MDDILDDIVAVLPPLLQGLERLGFVARHFDPPHLRDVLTALGEPDAALAGARARLDAWPDSLSDVRTALTTAIDVTVAAFAALRSTPAEDNPVMAVAQAFRNLPEALAALYPLASRLPPVNRFFLDPTVREDADLADRLAQAPARPDTGVFHFGNAPGERGGVSLYVPETYDPDAPAPLVVALHGGSGHGSAFLWSWLREARSQGAIVAAPTSVGRTWALQGDDPDTPNLARLLSGIRRQWSIDERRLLLTGMSDGGTFAYVSGLEPGSPFTHLAPFAAAFHPLMAAYADPGRVRGLPIHITHGARDWMFEVDMARSAAAALRAAGADVVYRELDDLSHSYPRELNLAVLEWLDRGA